MKKIVLFSIILLIIDIFWIKNVMSKLYEGIFEIKNVNYLSALIAYSFMIIGYIKFINSENNINEKFKKAIFLGLVIYATYGFTLAAIYKKYPLRLALIETLWGGFLYLIVTYIVNKII